MIIQLVKNLGSYAAYTGVAVLTTQVIKQVLPDAKGGKLFKACLQLGTWFIAGVAATAASNEWEKRCDDVDTGVKELKKAIKEADEKRKQEENKENEEEIIV